MRFILRHYLRTIVTILVGCVSILLFCVKVIDNNDLKQELKLEDPSLNAGYTKDFYTGNKYIFDVEENTTICMGDEFEPENYVQATYYDGSSLVDYVVTQNMPEDTETPGEYEIEYIFIFEGEQKIKTLKLIIEDKSINGSCPAYNGGKECLYDSECPTNTKCVYLESKGKKTCIPFEEQYIDDLEWD